MNSLTFDSLPPINLVVDLKDNPENKRNSLIIGLYGSCTVATKHENNIARNLKNDISISSSEDESPLKQELLFLDIEHNA
jgi:hypothetical protein